MSSPKKRNLKRPAIKISTKRSKIGIKLRKTQEKKKQLPSTLATSTVTAVGVRIGTSTLSGAGSGTGVSSSPQQKAIPSIFTKKYNTTSHESTIGQPIENSNDENQNDEYNNDTVFNEIFDKFIQETDDVDDIILAMQSLIRRHSAAVCSFISENQNMNHNNCNYVTFLLKPMIKYALLSKSSESSTSKDTIHADQVTSAYISTGFNMDLEKLDSENKIRLIQLHGMTDDGDDDRGTSSNDDENIAVLFMNDYINGVYDALSYNEKNNGDCDNDSSSYDQNQIIVKLFLDCLHNYGCKGRFVTTTKLQDSLKIAWTKHREEANKSITSPTTIQMIKCHTERWIEYLVHIQLLLPRVLNNSQSSCTSSYWYTLPKMGIAAKIITEGRKKMMNRIKRSYNKEVRRSTLEQLNMVVGKSNGSSARKLSSMTGSFHVRDLLSRDVVKGVQRSSGEFIRF